VKTALGSIDGHNEVKGAVLCPCAVWLCSANRSRDWGRRRGQVILSDAADVTEQTSAYVLKKPNTSVSCSQGFPIYLGLDVC